jgi:hypothetical protein
MVVIKFVSAAGLLAVAFGAASACSTQGTEVQGSETNWLDVCASNSDCKVGQCVCGACTTACEQTTSCNAVLDTCATRGTAAFGAFCGANTTTAGACLKGCAGAAACPTGTECIGTGCVPVRVSSNDTDAATGSAGPALQSTTYDAFTEVIPDPPAPDGGTGALSGLCLPRALKVNAQGETSCSIVVVGSASCDCSAPGLSTPDSTVMSAIIDRLRVLGSCDVPGTPACSDYCGCEVAPYAGAAFDDCLTSTALDGVGWCYVDPAVGWGLPALTAECPPTEKRLLRMKLRSSGSDARTFISCTTETSQPAPADAGAPGAIGDPCVPLDESKPAFSGFDETEVNVETSAPDCGGNVCLTANFRGRVSCPYGQPSDPATGGAQSGLTPEQECFLPGTTATAANAVTVPVNPQLVTRRAADVVTCSCRCDGPDLNATYCTCPSGFVCQNLVPSGLSAAGAAVAGSYCIKDGTQVTDPTRIAASACDEGPPANCGDPHPDGK